MALEAYQAKRNFKVTPEPRGSRRGTKSAAPAALSFVIQKHDATRLHYDFRLELDGALKSWAITRGPSLNPDEKRLAVHVEDHPLDYGDFEGIIPKGQYGGGTVLVWDRGTWTPNGDPHKGYKKGHLEFDLDGEKLSGRWHLVRMHGKPAERQENWLLIKAEDEEARHKGDILKQRPESVKSGRKIEEIAKHPDATWNSRPKGTSKPTSAKPAATPPKPKRHEWPKGAEKAAMPAFVEPELAKLKTKPPSGEGWIHEIKFDGYRLQVRLENGRATLLTRSGLDWTEKFGQEIVDAFVALPAKSAILDGEIVVERENGASDFSSLQNDLSQGRHDRFVFYAFDLLYLDGYGLQQARLINRKALLLGLLADADGRLRYSEHFAEKGALVLDHVRQLGLEGIISKLADSEYVSGRTGEWVKSKCLQRQELVIGGYVPSTSMKNAIGSLAMGVNRSGKLEHVGRVGTGFSVNVAQDLYDTLSAMEQSENSFDDELTAEERRGLVYVRPELVAEVEFQAWSADGNLRHAAFRGLREDKAPEDVMPEATSKTAKELPQSSVTLTHPDRIYWPEEGITKQGLASYYAGVWRFIEPYVTKRPLALLRCPDGIGGQRFFQKHAWKGMNSSIEQITDPKDRGGEKLLRIMDFDGMIALVQSAVLEIHPWGATTASWERPDMITMDLDPADGVSWTDVIAAAHELKERLEAAGLAAFVKTSGGKGLHVVTPLKPKASWTQVKAFAKALADGMSKDQPDKYLATATKAKRNGKIFIDYLRNGRGNTAVAAYSTRARPGAAVSMPLEWKELTEEIGPAYFTVDNAPARLNTLRSDPWADFFAAAVPLEKQK
ncbi:bifunctional non-homologous end joining protein LigD [Rhizobium tibeticum]|uniref:DNA ligase (ATP) n=1 Tax=Rhizobium tibeticum TaxID=501024 RepID=A0A1H8H496_9HYPH|nr:DNA ligase D [Rhizobium tibeticum]MDP9810212.1 bifunctional non-homologous end joining protein LigD [Rhizobium tibeticum]SEH64022.1 putative ATP-dependent DNA ligase YkoU [Rhizobium tibeticum]SEN50557.1 ATP-dependent DNA ligase LigD phosphoesterase module /ATP-dependent DNA ligase LigD polymerase module [Rhizobium tibeticum]